MFPSPSTIYDTVIVRPSTFGISQRAILLYFFLVTAHEIIVRAIQVLRPSYICTVVCDTQDASTLPIDLS